MRHGLPWGIVGKQYPRFGLPWTLPNPILWNYCPLPFGGPSLFGVPGWGLETAAVYTALCIRFIRLALPLQTVKYPASVGDGPAASFQLCY
jgi:hypothetical protein